MNRTTVWALRRCLGAGVLFAAGCSITSNVGDLDSGSGATGAGSNVANGGFKASGGESAAGGSSGNTTSQGGQKATGGASNGGAAGGVSKGGDAGASGKSTTGAGGDGDGPGISCTSDAMCDDGNACNGVETCDGACVPGEALAVDDQNACTTDACNALTGVVSHTDVAAAQNVASCIQAQCDAKTGKVTLVELYDDKNKCTDDSCDPSTGPIHTDINYKDRDPCTVDTCDPEAGPKHIVADGCTGCSDTYPCDDGNPCTADSCQPDGTCKFDALGSDTSCGDGNACNGDETCDPGLTGNCLPGTPPTLDDGDVCTADTCDPTGQNGVQHVPVPVDDGDACTDDACVPGVGVQHVATKVDDDDPCTTDTCDSITGPKHVPIAGCQACSSADDCTGQAPPCHVAECSGGKCVFTNPTVACSDGDACTDGDTCKAGKCTAGAAVNVDDGNQCTTDSCDSKSGVAHKPIAGCAPCSSPSDCADLTCHSKSCSNSLCTYAPVGAGQSCDDGNVCNGKSTCDGSGNCASGAPPAVDDGNACTSDGCDPTGGVTHTSVDPNDGNACTTDSCDPASGPRHVPVNIDDGDPCTTDTCDPASGAVGHAGCASPQICHVVNGANQGCCTPNPDVCDAYECGSMTDSCGIAHSCGTCPTGTRCQVHFCVDPCGGLEPAEPPVPGAPIHMIPCNK